MTADKLIRISGVEYDNSVGKRLELDLDGKTVRKTVLADERSNAGRVINKAFETPKELFEFRKTSDARRMFVMGTFAPDLDDGIVLPAGAVDAARRQFESYDRPTIVSLTKGHLAFREGPGVLSIDIDYKELNDVAVIWPGESPLLRTADDVLAALYDVLPEAKDNPVMVTPSSSSMIRCKSTGTLLRGPGGWRVLIVVDDATHIPRLLQVIHLRCWAQGKHRYAFLSASGWFLDRSLADQALSRPTQPDYPTADLGDGLVKNDEAVTRNLDGPYLVPTDVELSVHDKFLAAQNIDRARQALKPHSDAIKASRKDQDVRAAIERGVPKEQAERAVAQKFDAGVLLGSEVIKFAHGEEVSVCVLLSSAGEAYDQRNCFDPIEPGYDGGRLVGKFFWNGGMRPGVCSFAHGQKFYHLRYDAKTARAAIDHAESESALIPLIFALADLSSLEEAQLEKHAAQALGLGNNRKALRTSVGEQRARIASYRVEHDVDNGQRPGHQITTSSLGDKLLPTSFPQTKLSERGILILDHQDNIAHLLDSYGITYRYNLISKDFEWTHDDFSDTGDHAAISLHSQLVSLCALNSVPSANIQLHLTALGERAGYNPVVEHLSSLKWDGVSRFEKLADAMEADDKKIARIALRLFLVQACAAADHRERHPKYRAHFEGVLVFVGAQGIGKTNGLFKLFPAALRATCVKEGQVLDTRNKDSVKAVVSTWCSELGELDGTFRKSDIAALKAFLSQERDEIRLPYAPKPSVFRRRTIFAGTVNDVSFLADETGNRRFWPLTVTRVDVGWDDEEVDQLWAEAWGRYLAGEKWWPTFQEEALLAANAERYRSKSLIEQRIEERFDWDALPDWDAGRRTVEALYLELNPGAPSRYEQAELKKIGNALRRLWRQNNHSEVSNGVLVARNREGSLVKLNSDGGKNRGWLLPLRRGVQRCAANGAGNGRTEQDVKG